MCTTHSNACRVWTNVGVSMMHVQVLVLLGTMATASIVALLHTQAPPGALALLPWVTALWALTLPVAVFLQVKHLSPSDPKM